MKQMRKKQYHKNNKEKISKRKKERYQQNKEKILKQQKEHRENNKEEDTSFNLLLLYLCYNKH